MGFIYNHQGLDFEVNQFAIMKRGNQCFSATSFYMIVLSLSIKSIKEKILK